MTTRAVLYARVSSDDRGREGRNLAGQLSMGRKHAERQGWRVVAELAEDNRGASGASFDLPQLSKALEMARAGQFDVLVVRELDRFARGLAKQLIVEKQFEQTGVRIEYVLGDYPDTPEGALMKNVRAVIAEYERLKINERMTRGRRQKVKAGHVVAHGSPPYGYQLTEKDGKRTFEIVEQEAAIVRLIFKWYTVGEDGKKLSTAAIARKLSEMRAPTYIDNRPSKGDKTRPYGVWSRGSVHHILINQTYSGIWHYGKRGAGDNGERTVNDEEHLLAVEVPAIIETETWARVQRRLKNNRRKMKRRAKHKYLLRGHVICGHCGNRMGVTPNHASNGTVYLYYRCTADRQYATSCDNSVTYPARFIDPAIWDWLRDLLTNPGALQRGFDKYRAQYEEATKEERALLDTLDELIAEHRARLKKVLDLYLSDAFDRDLLVTERRRLEDNIAALERKKAATTVQLEAQALTEEDLQTVKTYAAKIVGAASAAEDNFERKRGLVELLNVEATMSHEDGKKVVKVKCALGERVLSDVSSRTKTREIREAGLPMNRPRDRR